MLGLSICPLHLYSVPRGLRNAYIYRQTEKADCRVGVRVVACDAKTVTLPTYSMLSAICLTCARIRIEVEAAYRW